MNTYSLLFTTDGTPGDRECLYSEWYLDPSGDLKAILRMGHALPKDRYGYFPLKKIQSRLVKVEKYMASFGVKILSIEIKSKS